MPDAGEVAPVDRAGLEAALRPFGTSRMLPRAAYVDPAVFEWERRHFFLGGWVCAGWGAELARPGAQRAVSIVGVGVLLVRGRDGVLRAFANTCRHRGHELLPCGGRAVVRALVLCPYHGWSYGLDGSLRRAPGYDDAADPGFDRAAAGLLPLRVEEWHGLAFVDVSGEAGPFSSHVEGLEEVVGPYELEKLRVGERREYVVASNWKILVENYEECYHCAHIHPEFCNASPPDSGADRSHPDVGAWAGGWMDLREGVATMSLDGRSPVPPLRGLDAWRRRIVDYIAVFPNLLLSLHPDFVMTHLLTPFDVARTRVECAWSFSPEAFEQPGFDPGFAVGLWDLTNGQDWRACESVQRGLAYDGAVPGPLSAQEAGVYQFVTMVARGYLGRPVTPAPETAEAAL
jgi:Rieske 2Fe-2S family protein